MQNARSLIGFRNIRVLNRILRLFFPEKQGNDPISKLTSRPDITITNPSYVHLAKDAYVGHYVTILTPPQEGIPNTGLFMYSNSAIHDRSEICVSSGSSLTLGEYSKIGINCIVHGEVELSHYSSIGPNVFISAEKMSGLKEHKFWVFRDAMLANDKPRTGAKSRVFIGEDCFIGAGVYIRGGIYIGKGAMIGANSVVLRDVPPYSKQIGSPAREFEKRLVFEPPQSLTATQENHWPYFYGGFYLRQAQIERSRNMGVLFARNHSSLVLSGGKYKSLQIKGRILDGTKNLSLSVQCNKESLGEKHIEGQEFSFDFDLAEKCFSTSTMLRVPYVLRQFNLIELKATMEQGPDLNERIAYGIDTVALS